MSKSTFFTYVRVTWPVRLLDWLLSRSILTMIVFCLALGFAISYASAAVQQLTDHWISGAVAQIIFVGVLMAVLVFAMVQGLLRLMGEQVLQHVSGPDALRLMSARSLELLAAALFEAQGLKVRMRAIPGEPDVVRTLKFCVRANAG